jgi:hypothetical protein
VTLDLAPRSAPTDERAWVRRRWRSRSGRALLPHGRYLLIACCGPVRSRELGHLNENMSPPWAAHTININTEMNYYRRSTNLAETMDPLTAMVSICR